MRGQCRRIRRDDQEICRGESGRALDHGRRLVDGGIRSGRARRRELIDAVVPDRPVILWSRDGHTTWVNSKALEVAGITKKTPDPPDGRIDRDPKTGAAVGSLQEGASSLVASKMPPTSDAKREEGLRYASQVPERIRDHRDPGCLGQRGRPEDLPQGSTRRARSRCTSSDRSGGNATRASSRSKTSSVCGVNSRRAMSTPARSRSCRTA